MWDSGVGQILFEILFEFFEKFKYVFFKEKHKKTY